MTSEFARIARIDARLRRGSPDVLVDIGDDCAVLAPSDRPRVWTVDAAVDTVHFSRALMTLEDIGYRAFMAAASDVAAMGARAVAALSALTLPDAMTDDELDALVEGIAQAADACTCPVIGGNLARAGALTLTTSVLGECPSRVLTRRGARPGDGVFVSGPLGGSALGLALLQQGHRSLCEAAVACFLRPRARLDVALRLADVAHAAIDVSDGLAQDVSHLCRASGVGAEIELAQVPAVEGARDAAARIGRDMDALIAQGGEDYEVIFTADPARVAPELGTRIGVVTDAPEVMLRGAQGAIVPLAGFDHFR